MLRLFVAVDLPGPARQAAASLCTGLPGARFANPDQLHITLRFMGQTPEEHLALVRERLASVRAPRFELRLEGLGTFPPLASKARVLWLALAPEQPLVELARQVDDRLGDLGHAADQQRRAFTPHLTLARFGRPPAADLAPFLACHAGFHSLDWKVDCFHLYRSTLRASGATHEVLGTYPLGTI